MVQFKVYQKTDTDCFQCCVASLMGWDYHTVPNFFARSKSGEPIDQRDLGKMDRWFDSHDLVLARFPLPVETAHEAMDLMAASQPPNLSYILTGRTVKGVAHAVICRGDRVLHDPAKPTQPLVHPHENGVFTVYIIALK